jgi:catecholate siderophore receptor
MDRAFTRIGGGLGTDNYHRLTLDTNQPLEGLGTDSALRLGFNESTRLTLSAFHQTDDNLPDYGVPALDGKKLAGVSREDYFGWKNLDKEEIEQNAFTANFEHDFNDNLRLQNLTRYSRVDRDTVVSASHVNLTGVPAGNYRPAGPQAYGRDVTTDMWINQTNLRASFDTAGLGHELVTGVELSRENLDLKTYNHGLGNALYPADGYDLANPPGQWNGPINKTITGYTENQLDNKALYVFDTIALSEQWDLNLGLRYDWFDAESETFSATQVRTGRFTSKDEELSSRAGLVYKPTDNGRIYVAWGNSFNPSAESVATSGGGLNGNTQNLDPEKNETWELGTKWEFLGGRLMLDGAVFRVEKTDAREQLADGSYILAGEQRVQGVELGATGKVTDRWNVYANYTFLDSETLKSEIDPAREGQALGNTPPHSFNLWTTYELPQGWTLGYGARYVSERNVSSSTQAKLDDYWLHNAMVGYKVSDNLDLQLNVNNLFDEDYVERVRQNIGTTARSSAIEYGDARSAMLSATYSF